MSEKAIIFCRISDQKQDDGFSLAAQEKYAREYCEQRKFSIQNVYSIVETGSKAGKRTKFEEMVKDIQKQLKPNTAQLHLIVEKPDRLTRNFTSKEQLETLVTTGKLVIHYYKDRRIVDKFASPADIFTEDIMTSLSKYTAGNIARETRKGMKEKAAQGCFPARPPIGYKNVREGNEDKNGRRHATIAVDEQTKPAVLRIFELRALKHFSYKEIGDVIREEKLLLPKRAKTLTKSSIQDILKNPFYIGQFYWQGELYDGKHELFVPAKWFRKSQEMNGTTKKRKPKGTFSNYLKCADPACGLTILYDPKVKKLKQTDEIVTYHYYHCSDGRDVHKNNSTKQANVPERLIWKGLEAIPEEICINERLARAVSVALKSTHDKAISEHKDTINQHKEEIAAKELEEDKATELLLSGVLDKDIYARMIKRIRSEKRRYVDLLEQNQMSITDKFYETSEQILELCIHAKSLWEKTNAEEKLQFLEKVLSNQYLDGSTIRYDLKKPFAVLSEMKKNEFGALGRT